MGPFKVTGERNGGGNGGGKRIPPRKGRRRGDHMPGKRGRWRGRPGRRRRGNSTRGRGSQRRRPLKGRNIARGRRRARSRRRRHRGCGSCRELLGTGKRGATTVETPKMLRTLSVVARAASRQVSVEAPLGTEQGQTQQALISRLERRSGEVKAPMKVVNDSQRSKASLAPKAGVLSGGEKHVARAQRTDGTGVMRGNPLFAAPETGAEEVRGRKRGLVRSRRARSDSDGGQGGDRGSQKSGVARNMRRGPGSTRQAQGTQW